MNKGQRVMITSVAYEYKDYGKRGVFIGLHSAHNAIVELDDGERWVGNRFDMRKVTQSVAEPSDLKP